METRVQRAIEEITGNEALLEMLDTEAAAALLEWGIGMVKSLVQNTDGTDETAEDSELARRLKAVRQVMRSGGNWAAGKYPDAESRVPLRDKLLEYIQTIAADSAAVPSAESLDAVLNEADDPSRTPQQLIAELKTILPQPESN